MRRINLLGDVNTDMVELLFNSLDDLEAESNAPIEVFLCSGGGATNCALAIYGRIKRSKAPITMVAFGEVQSAAVLIYAAGHKRAAYKSTWFMVHEESGNTDVNSTTDMVKMARQWQREENLFNALLAQETDKTELYWSELSKATTFFLADEAKKLHKLVQIILE